MTADLKRRANRNPSKELQKELASLLLLAKKGNARAASELLLLASSSKVAERAISALLALHGSGLLAGRFPFYKGTGRRVAVVRGGAPGLGKRR
jgi:hypothetical protein